jgi:hypothetical protein
MSTSNQPLIIHSPGFYDGVRAVDYHADPAPEPSLSSTIARTIINRSLRHAFLEHRRLGCTEPKKSTAAMDRGTLVHALLAGTVSHEIEVGKFPTFRSKLAQEWEAEVARHGRIAVLEDDYRNGVKIADAIREKATRGTTVDPFEDAKPEVSAFWQKKGAWFRARYDRLILNDSEPSTVWDWKTTTDVSIGAVKRTMRKYGLHHQAAHYLAGLDALRPQFARLHSFVFVFVEDEPPYSVRRYCVGGDTHACAAIEMDAAHEAWIKAVATGEWPDASSDKTTFVEIPTYDDDDDNIQPIE